MPFQFLGLGTALPEYAIEQTDAAVMAQGFSSDTDDHRRLLPELYRRTGVGRRYSVLLNQPNGAPLVRQNFYLPRQDATDCGPTTGERMQRYTTEALPLALAAATAALADAGMDPQRITHLVTVSCSGFAAPGWDIGLIGELGLSLDVARTHVGFMGCHGAFNGLRVAHAFTAADPEAVALVTAVELCTLHNQYGWEPDRVVANALFADGAAAVVGCGGDAGRHSARSAQNGATQKGQTGGWNLLGSGSTLLPNTTDAMSWTIGDHGFEMTLSARVPDLIHRHLRPWLETWLAAHDVRLDQIGSWAVHPGGPRILNATTEALDLPADALAVSREVLRECGNMSSPTMLFLLDRLRHRHAPRPCVALGFGPGLAIEAALFG